MPASDVRKDDAQQEGLKDLEREKEKDKDKSAKSKGSTKGACLITLRSEHKVTCIPKTQLKISLMCPASSSKLGPARPALPVRSRMPY